MCMKYVTKVDEKLDRGIPGVMNKGLATEQATFFEVVEQKDDGIARRMLNEITHHFKRSDNTHTIVSDTIASRDTVYSNHISRSNLSHPFRHIATYHNER